MLFQFNGQHNTPLPIRFSQAPNLNSQSKILDCGSMAPESITENAYAYLKECHAAGNLYVPLFLRFDSPSYEVCVKSLVDAIEKANAEFDIECRIIVLLDTHKEKELCATNLKRVLSYFHPFIAGAELTEHCDNCCSFAKKGELDCTIHRGTSIVFERLQGTLQEKIMAHMNLYKAFEQFYNHLKSVDVVKYTHIRDSYSLLSQYKACPTDALIQALEKSYHDCVNDDASKYLVTRLYTCHQTFRQKLCAHQRATEEQVKNFAVTYSNYASNRRNSSAHETNLANRYSP